MAICLLVAFVVCAIVSLAQSGPVNRSCETSISTLKAAVELTNEASVSKQIQLDTVWW